MNIVLSGGWGYGNLGDDAILDSTIQLLREKHPHAHIDVLTYSKQDSLIHQSENVILHLNAHAMIDHQVCEARYPEVNKNYSLINKVYSRIADIIVESQPWFHLHEKLGRLQDVEEVIKNADLYIMSGGGYFNEKWMAKTRSQLWELDVAQKYNIPFYILGPTIGTFSPTVTTQIEKTFRAAKKISVRDDFSFSQISGFRNDATLIPDVALSTWLAEQPVKLEKSVGVIFTNLSHDLQLCVSNVLTELWKQGEIKKVTLFISRRWKYDFYSQTRLQMLLLRNGVKADIIFPPSFVTLEEGLASCSMVISENLHGLILAARNLVPVVAINDYKEGSPNYKKFIAFLKQASSEDAYLSSSMSQEDMLLTILDVMKNSISKCEQLHSLRLNVRESNINIL